MSSAPPAPIPIPANDDHLTLPGPQVLSPKSPGFAFDVPDVISKGSMMTKVAESGLKRLVFRIDPEEGSILWKSKKGGIVPLETIKELRTGLDGRYYRAQFRQPEAFEQRWITVIYILKGNYKTLHIVADTVEVFTAWDTTLRKLYTIRQGLTAGLGNIEMRQALWERQYWKGADVSGDKLLDFDEVKQMIKRLHANIPTSSLQKLFVEVDVNKSGQLDFAEFQLLVKKLKQRPDIEQLYGKITGANGGKFGLEAFTKFMQETQQSSLSVEELKEMFNKYAAPAPTSTLESITNMLTLSESSGVITLENFTKFLLSLDNTAFAERGKGVFHDMTRPLSEYYISSSHNTYLVGNQLIGVSTIEGYIRALLHSCRSVELDIYPGDPEPVITHGGTLTSKVPLRDICNAIMKYGFMTSPYPILISAEVHCDYQQQEKIVDVMSEVFGESLVQAPVENRPKLTQLPSPEELKYKVLLKAKNHYAVKELHKLHAAKKLERRPSTTDTETDDTWSDQEAIKSGPVNPFASAWKKLTSSGKSKDKEKGKDKAKTKLQIQTTDPPPSSTSTSSATNPKMSFRLAALLVFTVGVRCNGLRGVQYAPEHIFSLSEVSANKVLKEGMQDLIQHTLINLVRIYPKGTRVGSTNFEPHRYWAAGAQVVALNWQTFDRGYLINQSMFQRNGRCGFVLKPEALRFPQKEESKKHTKHFLDVTIISAQHLPPLRDSKGQEVFGKSIPDPFVEVSLLIPDWSRVPFLPESAKREGAEYIPAHDAPPATPIDGPGYNPIPATPVTATPLTAVPLTSTPSQANFNTTNSGSTSAKTSGARTVILKTKVVRDNGFNPVWNQELHLPFDCVGGMKDLIFVNFAVRQEGKDGEDDEPLASYCIPLGSLNMGYRHLALHDSQMNQHLFSTLFVHLGLRDV